MQSGWYLPRSFVPTLKTNFVLAPWTMHPLDLAPLSRQKNTRQRRKWVAISGFIHNRWLTL